MAVAVSQIVLKEGKTIFDADESYAYETRLQANTQHLIMCIACVISDLAVLASEEGRSGGVFAFAPTYKHMAH